MSATSSQTSQTSVSDLSEFAAWEKLHPLHLQSEDSRLAVEDMEAAERVWKDRDSSNDARSSEDEGEEEELPVTKVDGGKRRGERVVSVNGGRIGKAEIASSTQDTHSQEGRSQNLGPDFEAPPSSQPRPQSEDEEDEAEGDQKMQVDDHKSASEDSKQAGFTNADNMKMKEPNVGADLLAKKLAGSLTEEEYKKQRKYAKKARKQAAKQHPKPTQTNATAPVNEPNQTQKPSKKQKQKKVLRAEPQLAPDALTRSGTKVEYDTSFDLKAPLNNEPKPDSRKNRKRKAEMSETEPNTGGRTDKKAKTKKGETVSSHFEKGARPKSHQERQAYKAGHQIPKAIKKMMAVAAKAVGNAADVVEKTVKNNVKAKLKREQAEEGDDSEKITKRKRKRERNHNRLAVEENVAGSADAQEESTPSAKKSSEAKKTDKSQSQKAADLTTDVVENSLQIGEPAQKKRRRDRGRKSDGKQKEDADVSMVDIAAVDVVDSAPSMNKYGGTQLSQGDIDMILSQPAEASEDVKTPHKKEQKPKKKRQSQEVSKSQEVDDAVREVDDKTTSNELAETNSQPTATNTADTPHKKEKNSKKNRQSQELQSNSQEPKVAREPEALNELADTNTDKAKTRKLERTRKHSVSEPIASQASEEGAKFIHS